MMHKLTKTAFLQYLACPEELWLSINVEDSAIPPSLNERHLMEQGRLIDDYAQDYFINHLLHKFEEKGLEVLFQKTFEAESFLARADVLTINHRSNSLDIYEVKASTSVKDEHIQDVAFQKMVMEASGWKVENAYLVYVNNTYALDDEWRLEELFIVEEITDRVNAQYPDVRIKAKEALTFINGPEPAKRITFACGNKLQCSFVQYHYSDFPDYTVFDISRINTDKLEMLIKDNILDIMDVPPHFKLSDKQRLQVDIAQKNEIVIDREAIEEELGKLAFPLYFLDYETFAYAVPFQRGYSPYQQMLFQYSLHVIEKPGAEVKHYEYLLSQKDEPVSQLLSNLNENMSTENGTVLVWNKSFEQSRNKECAEMYPQYADFLLSVNDRIYDLMDVFKKGFYLHPGFKGKNSLKSVLPVLCPELSYDILPIQNGTEANIHWHHWTDGQFSGEENDFIKQALLGYCKLDTWAMVRIWQELDRIQYS